MKENKRNIILTDKWNKGVSLMNDKRKYKTNIKNIIKRKMHKVSCLNKN